jgi:hypothetical protein
MLAEKKTKKAYGKPKIVSQKIFEQTALACTYSIFSNSQTDLKTNAIACGYNDS